MKQLKIFAAALLALLFVAGCDDDEDVLAGDSLTMVSSEITFPHEGGSSTIAFEASTTWTISSDSTWVSFSKTSGDAGSASVTITVDENETYSERSATATIAFGSSTSTIKIVQTELTEFSSVMEYTISAEAQDVEVVITSNVDYSYEIDSDATSWISAASSTKAAPTESTLTFTVKANTEISPRSGKIYITAGEAVQCVVINQLASYDYMDTATSSYIGNRMLIYDNEEYSYTSFGEYVITLASEDGTSSIVLAVNVDAPDSPLTALPTGTFSVDATAKHAASTFSIKDVDGSDKYYTTIYDGDSETLVYDGEITISLADGVYTITAILLDSADNEHLYSYEGAIEISDDSYGGYAVSNYVGQYYTYYGSGTYQNYVNVYLSSAPDENTTYLSYFSIHINHDAGTSAMTEIPEGTYTYAEREYLTSSYYSENNAVNTFTYFSANDPDYSVSASATAGTIKVSKNSDGTYNFEFDLTLSSGSWGWDENDNYVYTAGDPFSYKGTISDVALEIGSGYLYEPCPDGDAEFTYAMYTTYTSLYHGDAYGTGCNAYTISFSYINNNYNMYLTLNLDDGFVYEVNFSRYCNTMMGTGTFEYSGSETPAANSIVPCLYSYITNSYSGVKCYICGGSVTLTDSSLTFNNLQALDESTGNVYTYTGTIPATLYYHRNVSTGTYSSYYAVRIPSYTAE